MILDNMQHCATYFGTNEKFEKAFAFINEAVAKDLPVGKYEIEGKELFASVQAYESKLVADAKFEGHNNYIDIQYIVEGKELMKVADISKMTVKTPYNSEKDVTFYEDNADAAVVPVQQEEYAIFFPHDIHMPGVSVNETPSAVRKIVVKVKV